MTPHRILFFITLDITSTSFFLAEVRKAILDLIERVPTQSPFPGGLFYLGQTTPHSFVKNKSKSEIIHFFTTFCSSGLICVKLKPIIIIHKLCMK